jgi:hypothetical protein
VTKRLTLRMALVAALVVLLAGGAWAAFVAAPASDESFRAESTGSTEGGRALSDEARASASGGGAGDDATCEPGYGGYDDYGYGYGYGYERYDCADAPTTDTGGKPGGRNGYGGGYGHGGGYGNGGGYGYGSGYGG